MGRLRRPVKVFSTGISVMRLAICILVVLLLAACSSAASQPTVTAADYPSLPADLVRARVMRVVDGDTVDVRLDGRVERVRLIGINTPESVDPRRPVECFGVEAAANAHAMLDGQVALLEADPSQGDRDPNGRLLRYLWLADGRLVNLEQIAQGYAFEYTYAAPYRYQDQFRAAERAARAAEAGLWSPATCGGRRGLAEASPTAGQNSGAAVCATPAAGQVSPEQPVRIVALDKTAELVRLQNVSDAPVNLDGWALCSMRGGEVQAGVGGTLAPGATRDFANPGEPLWSNSNRDDAALYDPAGRLVSYWVDRSSAGQ